MKPITKETGEPLVIKLEKTHGLKAVGWQGQRFIKITPKHSSITLERVGWSGLPKTLIFIPQKENHQAQIKTVEPQIKKLKFENDWQPLEESKVALWGQTPQGVCSLFIPLEDTNAPLHVVTFPKRKATSTGGAFYLEFDKQPQLAFHFSTNHGLIKTIDSPQLKEASKEQRLLCKRYHGGECDVVLEVPDEAYGKLHKLKFPKIEKNSTPCPV